MDEMVQSSGREKEMLAKARRYCARAEQCSSGVRQKLEAWGASEAEADAVMQQLIAERYVDDARYVRLFCAEKMLMQHWGKKKVVYHLQQKGFPRGVIVEGLEAVDGEDYRRALVEQVRRKRREVGVGAEADRKLVRLFASRGFAYGEIMQALRSCGDDWDGDGLGDGEED